MSERVRKLGLRDREIESFVTRQAHDLEPQVQLAQEMRDPRVGTPPTHVDEPLAQNGLILQHRPPERPSERRARFQDVENRLTGKIGDLARRQCADRMIHLVEDEDMQIAGVAGNQIGHDLPAAFRQDRVATAIALDDDVHVIG
jgi:hypothetical protein